MNRFGVLIIEAGLFVITYLTLKFFMRRDFKYTSLVLLVIALILYFRVTFKKNWLDSSVPPPNYAAQMAVKDTGSLLNSELPSKSILLIHAGNLEKAHLYFQYWSGFDSVDIAQYDPHASLIGQIKSKNQNIYLVSDSPLPQLILIKQVPFGYLYSIPQ